MGENYIKARWWYTGIIGGLALMTWGLTLLAKRNPEKVESLYASKIYPHIANTIGKVVGKVPFSVAEIAVLGAVLGVIFALATLIFKPDTLETLFHGGLRALGIGYILFYFIWGFNYYREDYIDLAGMSQEVPTTDDLKGLIDEMISKVNGLRETLQEDESGVFTIKENFYHLAEIAKDGFENYQVGDVKLPQVYGTAKPLLVSKAMSHTGITGIYFPYTGEPNVNADIPSANIPATICHEIGHQMGFAKEEEANFIAYKASVENPSPQFQYSGYYLGLQHLLSDLYKVDPQGYGKFYAKISPAVRRDMDDEYHYWKAREGKVEKAATALNDNYLKTNNQSLGVKSYNGVVRLLLAEYKSR